MNLCCADDCIHHAHDCPRDETCTCGAALAAPGSLVCAHHHDTTRQWLRELPELWAILGAKPGSGRGAGNSEPPSPLSMQAVDARDSVRLVLVTWCKILEEDRGSPLPEETKIAANTRQDVMRHQDAYQHVMAVWRGTPADDAARHHLLQAAAHAHAAAERARESRETGSDIIEALREHIDRHLAWLLNSEHADQIVHDVRAVHQVAQAAIPTRTTGIRILCDCGHRIPVSTDRDAIMTCPGCQEWGTLSWWRARQAPALDGPLTLRELPDWLLTRRMVVTHKQLRNWHDRGILTPHNLVMTPTRYDPEAVAVIATARLGRRSA